MWIRHRNKFISLFVAVITAIVTSFFYTPNVTPNHSKSVGNIEQSGDASNTIHQQFNLTPQRRIHILDGDGTGGGHRAGAGKPGKTEFPASWDDAKIIATVTRIANDENLPMRQSGKRYWIRMGEEDELQIRVVLDRERGIIITGYPVNRPKN